MTSTQNSGPLPTHVVTWHPDNYDGRDTIGAGQWLYCTKDTGPGDRQIVWSGIRGAGLVAVVDFQGEVRPRSAQAAAGARRLYEGWARVTPLDRPLSVDEVKSHPVISRAFGHSIQGPQRLDPDIAAAIENRLGGFPPAPSFNSHPPNWDDLGGDWGPTRLPPEIICEEIVTNSGRLARKLGFNGAVQRQKILNNKRRPDLWTPGVVGDVKNQATIGWGPEQVADYIDICQEQWPEHEWRGVLVQGVAAVAPSAITALRANRHRNRITFWSVTKSGRLRPPKSDAKRFLTRGPTSVTIRAAESDTIDVTALVRRPALLSTSLPWTS